MPAVCRSFSATPMRASAKERAYVELMISTRVDGVIIAPAGRTATPLKPLLAKRRTDRAGRPRRARGFLLTWFAATASAGARTLANHLLALGHERIALINGTS